MSSRCGDLDINGRTNDTIKVLSVQNVGINAL